MCTKISIFHHHFSDKWKGHLRAIKGGLVAGPLLLTNTLHFLLFLGLHLSLSSQEEQAKEERKKKEEEEEEGATAIEEFLYQVLVLFFLDYLLDVYG